MHHYRGHLLVSHRLSVAGSEGDAGRDFDFLSSIEVVVIDQVDALMQQNWEHVTSVMKVLNLIPKSPRDTDFSRVRHWNLDGHARFKRQVGCHTVHGTATLLPHTMYRSDHHNVTVR